MVTVSDDELLLPVRMTSQIRTSRGNTVVEASSETSSRRGNASGSVQGRTDTGSGSSTQEQGSAWYRAGGAAWRNPVLRVRYAFINSCLLACLITFLGLLAWEWSAFAAQRGRNRA